MICNTALVLMWFVSVSYTQNFPIFPIPPTQMVFRPKSEIGSYRLPTDTIPISYEITVEPFFYPDFVFNGDVSILIDVKEATSHITLHAKELTIKTATVTPEGSTTSISSGFSLDALLHFIRIDLNSATSVGTRLNIRIEYKGILNEKNQGFYRANYKEHGSTKWFATTQFQMTYAREAFPCYDEPALKAVFKVRIIRPAEYSSISNMELVRTEKTADGKFKDIFQDTLVMSSYMVAFVVSGFIAVGKGSQTVFGAPELIKDKRGDYGLDVGIKTLAVIEDFVSIKYNLNKLYQVAIPDDWFWTGATGNWGLITYREKNLLYKKGSSTASEKEFVTQVIAHALAHQWFGNLVSPTWWQYIWLNEGFATYFRYYATDVIEPDFRAMELYVTYAYHIAMEKDALITTRPMSYDVQSPEEIRSVFDHIACEKAGAVIRMMEHFLSTRVFKRGLYRYLTNKAFSAATPSDLWEGLQEAANATVDNGLQGLTVARIMETWSNTAGYPVVYVERINGAIVLSQFRFLLLNDTNELESPWIIPINYATSANPNFQDTSVTHWLKSAEETTDIKINDDDWIILNKQTTGFYRVNYEDNNWNLIINYMRSNNFKNIQPLNRAQLIDDALNLARSGRLDYCIAMDLLLYLRHETDYIPFQSFFTGLTFLDKYLFDSSYFRRFVRDILKSVYNDLGTKDTGSHIDKLNRKNVLMWMCRYRDKNCRNSMHVKMISGNIIPPELQEPVYCFSQAHYDDGDLIWTMLYSRYSGSIADRLEKSRIVDALCCTRWWTLRDKLLDIVAGKDNDLYFSSAERRHIFSRLCAHPGDGLFSTYHYFFDNFDSFRSILSFTDVSTMIIDISETLTKTLDKEELNSLMASLPEDIQAEYNSTFTTALNNVQSNIDWANKYINSIDTWLAEHYRRGKHDSSELVTDSIFLLAAILLLHILQN